MLWKFWNLLKQSGHTCTFFSSFLFLYKSEISFLLQTFDLQKSAMEGETGSVSGDSLFYNLKLKRNRHKPRFVDDPPGVKMKESWQYQKYAEEIDGGADSGYGSSTNRSDSGKDPSSSRYFDANTSKKMTQWTSSQSGKSSGYNSESSEFSSLESDHDDLLSDLEKKKKKRDAPPPPQEQSWPMGFTYIGFPQNMVPIIKPDSAGEGGMASGGNFPMGFFPVMTPMAGGGTGSTPFFVAHMPEGAQVLTSVNPMSFFQCAAKVKAAKLPRGNLATPQNVNAGVPNPMATSPVTKETEYSFINHYTNGEFEYNGILHPEQREGNAPGPNSQASLGENEEKEELTCGICNDRATGLHYGIITCEG